MKDWSHEKTETYFCTVRVFILIAMYLCTLIFALIDSPVASDLLKASIAATIFVPVILYGLLLVTRLLKDDSKDNSDHK